MAPGGTSTSNFQQRHLASGLVSSKIGPDNSETLRRDQDLCCLACLSLKASPMSSSSTASLETYIIEKYVSLLIINNK
jgi:hypothetical protein